MVCKSEGDTKVAWHPRIASIWHFFKGASSYMLFIYLFIYYVFVCVSFAHIGINNGIHISSLIWNKLAVGTVDASAVGKDAILKRSFIVFIWKISS